MQSQKPSVAVGAELPVGSQPLERLALEDAVLAQVVEHARLEAEEASVDPAVDLRLLVEGPLTRSSSSSSATPNWSSGRTTVTVASAPPSRWNVGQCGEVDVGHPVRVGGGEGPVDAVLGELDPAARRGVEAGVQAAHLRPDPARSSASTQSAISSPLYPVSSRKREKPCEL